MYAEKDSDELVFQKKPKSDALELMANDFSWFGPFTCSLFLASPRCLWTQYTGRGGSGVPHQVSFNSSIYLQHYTLPV